MAKKTNDFLIRFWIGLPLAASLFLGGMAWPRWIQAIVCTPVVFGCGWPILQKGARSFRTGKLNMFSLIAPGVLATYLFSLSPLAQGHYYFEAAAMPPYGGGDRRIASFITAHREARG